MISDKGRARIMDFWLAIPAAEAGGRGGPAGTPGYLVAELLGGVPYELFTGKKSFDASARPSCTASVRNGRHRLPLWSRISPRS